jgi:undecaprenyl-diphosphatase
MLQCRAVHIVAYIFLGIIQGLTEFIPVSSSAHLVLAEHWLRLNPPGVLLEIALHAGTLVSVLLVYGRDIWRILVRRDWVYTGYLLLATAITVAIVLPLKDWLSQLTEIPGAPRICGALLLVTAGWLIIADWRLRRTVPSNEPGVGWGRAALIGLAQSVAALPGISRSGATIGMGIVAGVKREEAARFSFLLSVLVIIGAALVDAKELPAGLASGAVDRTGLLLGFIAAVLTGILAIHVVLWMLKRARLAWFAAYCVALGVVALIVG